MNRDLLKEVAHEVVAELVRRRRARTETKRSWTQCSIKQIAAEILNAKGFPTTPETLEPGFASRVYGAMFFKRPERKLPAQFYTESQADDSSAS